jgi:hypothetical protein
MTDPEPNYSGAVFGTSMEGFVTEGVTSENYPIRQDR